MNSYSNGGEGGRVISHLSSYSKRQLELLPKAVWDDTLKLYVVGQTCSVCGSGYVELLSVALEVAEGRIRANCIKCDEASMVSSAVTNVIITG